MDAVQKAAKALHAAWVEGDLNRRTDWHTAARIVLDAVGYPAHQSSDEGTCWCPVAEQAGRERDAARAERDRLHRVVATYGTHEGDCPAYEDGDLSPDCECGWTHACIQSFEFAGQKYLDQEQKGE